MIAFRPRIRVKIRVWLYGSEITQGFRYSLQLLPNLPGNDNTLTTTDTDFYFKSIPTSRNLPCNFSLSLPCS